jgi:hypothetical protein
MSKIDYESEGAWYTRAVTRASKCSVHNGVRQSQTGALAPWPGSKLALLLRRLGSNFASPAEGGNTRPMLPLDRRFRFMESSMGFRDHWKGQEVVTAGGGLRGS